jgi:hypothetical protein
MTLNQNLLNEYFGNAWRNRPNRSLDQYEYTGWELIGKVRAGERVIDVGCGDNPFKDRIANLIGIDPAFPEADHQVTLEDFARDYKIYKFNVAFCLGSINFGTKEDIERQITSVVQLLREKDARIYWRCNPGRKDHGNAECEDIPFYDWSFDEHIRLAEMFNFEVTEMGWDTNNRIYAEWVSKNKSIM